MDTGEDSAATVSQPACPYCNAVCEAGISAPDVNRGVSKVVFHLARCTRCGLRFCTNPPADLAPYYTTDYHFVPSSAADLDPHLPAQKFKLDLLRRFKTSGDVLEIGPSTGMFCRLAQVAGFNVSAIEMDADCTRFLNDKLGVRALLSSDPTHVMAHEQRSYDAICLWHAIEHMPQPWRVLEQAAKSLKPGGILLVAAPNPDAWQARLLGWRWPHHDLPRHELATTRDEGSLYWNRFTWGMLARKVSAHPRLNGRLFGLGVRAGKVLQPWEGIEGKGATYTVVLRRPLA
jgi:SAM-dependent methyltransferase